MPIIKEMRGNILGSNCQTLVVGVNTYGVMGKGMALEFKDYFPDLFNDYRMACTRETFATKGIFVHTHSPIKKVLCFPSKRDWRYPSKIEYIEEALQAIARDYKLYDITSLAIPAVGCGLGKLKWNDVYQLIVKYLHPLPIDVVVYIP